MRDVSIMKHMIHNLNICSKNAFVVIKFLGRRDGESYYVREIAGKLDISLATVSRTLIELEKGGLVTREDKGRLAMYSVDIKNPLLREMKVFLTLIELNDLLLQLRNISSRIILFGSCVRGEDRSESDIDMVILSKNRKSVLKAVNSYQSERKISAIVLSKDEYFKLKINDKPFYNQIMAGKILWETEVDYEI